jgi:hypothetical protein
VSRRAFLPLAAACVLLVAGCGEGTDDGTRDRSPAKDAAEPATTTEATTPEPDAAKLPIIVTSPSGFQSVHRAFTLKGTATVFEGAVAWQILDASDEPLAAGTAQASCGTPCSGTFSTKVDVSKVEPGSWELHVFQPPVADDDPPRLHDFIVPITITTGPIDPDDPGPDAPPPGGAPTS